MHRLQPNRTIPHPLKPTLLDPRARRPRSRSSRSRSRRLSTLEPLSLRHCALPRMADAGLSAETGCCRARSGEASAGGEGLGGEFRGWVEAESRARGAHEMCC
jgi:hypothetical protein